MMRRVPEQPRFGNLRGTCAIACALSAALIGCQRPSAQRDEPQNSSNTTPEPAAPNVRTNVPAEEPSTVAVSVPGVGTCEPAAGVVSALSRAVDVADANGDGQLSKQEAYASTNFLVGGFFFRADENADGTVTPEEGRNARSELANRYPALGAALREAREAGQRPVANLLELADIQYGQPVSVAQMRDAARKAVDALYGRADANKDGTLTVAEARTAAWDGARSVAHAGFRAADTNKDGKLSETEFRGAMNGPLDAAFKVADNDRNGQLSESEASSAVRLVAQRLGLEPPQDTGQKGNAQTVQ